MKKTTALFSPSSFMQLQIQRLEQAITALYKQYENHREDRLSGRFDRHLFTEDGQTFAFYLAQISQTFTRLTAFGTARTEETAYLAERLTAQCTALTEAMAAESQRKGKSAVNFKPVLSEREKRIRAMHQLPPRERLTRYYEALQALNEKIARQEDLRHNADNAQERVFYSQQIKATSQRRTRCLEAIELLEEYLTFRQNQG